MIKAITFDFWNTLYKGPANRRVYEKRMSDVREVLKHQGFVFDFKEVGRAFQMAWEKAAFMQRAYGEDPTPRGHVEFALQELAIKIDDEFKEKLYQTYISTLLDIPPELNNDVQETLPALFGKYRMAVICNTGVTPGSTLRQLMKQDGILQYFDFLVFSDEVGWAKPNVEIFKYTLENIHMDSQNAAHIGDDEITDVIGAKKAGLTAVWLAPDKSWTVPEADYHVKSVKELLTIWKKGVE